MPKHLQLYYFILASLWGIVQAKAQNEITPLPLDKLNIDSLNQVIAQKEKEKNYKALGIIYGGMYNYYLYTGNRDLAVKYIDKAEENTLKAGDSARYYFILLHLADINSGVDFNAARQYYEKALAYYIRTKNYTLQGNALGGLSYVYGLYKDTPNLVKYLTFAEEAVRLSNDTFNIVGANDKHAHLFMHGGDIDAAISLLEKNLILIDNAVKFGNSETIRSFWKGLQLNLLADCYYLKKNYSLAIKYLKQAQQYDKEASYFDAQNIIRYRLLTNSYIQINQKDSALKYNDVFYNQALKTFEGLSPEKLKAIAAKYETEKNQIQITELQNENRLQLLTVSTQRKLNIALLSIFLLSLVIAFLIIKNIRQKRKIQLEAEKQKAALEKTQAVETERYRISSELHDDLGIGLSTIRLLSEMMKENYSGDNIEIQLDKISDSSKELVQKMNEIVWALNVNNDNLQSLLAYIRQYSAKALDDVGITCIFNMTENIPALAIGGNERRNIFLMVKECIHNIIKHSRASVVEIIITLQEDFGIKICDNGIGFYTAENDGNHFGLNNLKQRAKELNGTIEWQQSSGTIITIQIPLKTLSHKSAIA